MALEKALPKEIPPPADDSWRPCPAHRKKTYGLVTFIRSRWRFIEKRPNGCLETVSWYASERDRDNAILSANKVATKGILPIVALWKLQR